MSKKSKPSGTASLPVRPSNRLGIGCLLALALPFALAGTGIIGLGLWPLLRSAQSTSWTQIPAHIQEASVEVTSDSESGPTYRLVGRFRYDYEGRQFESTRLHFYLGSDSLSDFHLSKLEELKPFIRSDSMFPVFVNPSDPKDAVVFRDIRWGAITGYLLFGLVFAVVGFGLMIGGLRASPAEED